VSLAKVRSSRRLRGDGHAQGGLGYVLTLAEGLDEGPALLWHLHPAQVLHRMLLSLSFRRAWTASTHLSSFSPGDTLAMPAHRARACRRGLAPLGHVPIRPPRSACLPQSIAMPDLEGQAEQLPPARKPTVS
jgi:hypothetical protein